MEAYIKLLKYASDLQGKTYEDLYRYLHTNNIRFDKDHAVSLHNINLQTIFRNDFLDEHGNRPAREHRGLVYLRPEAYGYLLNYESLTQAKDDANAARDEAVEASRLAKKAIYIAIISLIITASLAVAQIILQWKAIP